jgi:hypothetical protein
MARRLGNALCGEEVAKTSSLPCLTKEQGKTYTCCLQKLDYFYLDPTVRLLCSKLEGTPLSHTTVLKSYAA